MTNKEIMKELFHDRLNQEKNRQRILARITSEPQKQVVYGKWLKIAAACMLVLVAAYVFYDQRNSTASKDKEVILHINEISKPIHIENDAEDCKKTEGEMIFDDCYEFNMKLKNKQTAFIRVAQITVEGDLVIADVLYDSKSDCIYLVKDDTRDRYLSLAESIISIRQYAQSGEWEDSNERSWILYNTHPDEIDSEQAAVEDYFILDVLK